MPKPRRNKTKSRKGSDTLHNDMKKLLEAQTAQEIKYRPEIPDPQRLRFKPNTLVNVISTYMTTFSTNTTGLTTGSVTALLSNLTNYTAYTTLYDQYRILQVNVKIFGVQNATLSPNAGNGSVLYTVIDNDDLTALSGIQAALAYNTLMITPGGVITERNFTPRFAVAAYSGGFTSYTNMPNVNWIDCNSPNVQFYGLKYVATSSIAIETFQVYATLAVQFRSQRSS